MKEIKVSWVVFEDEPFSINLLIESDKSDLAICEMLYRDTNLYQGELWDRIEPFLPATRNHTALSVGDEVTIDGITYVCADFGWKEKQPAA